MSETIREQIIQAFVTRAATVTIANGFNVGMGANVYRGIKNIDPSRLPACAIYPQPESVERRGSGIYVCTMPVRVVGVAFFGAENPSVVSELILGDLRKAFMSSRLSGLVEEIHYTNGGTDDYSKTDTVSASATFAIKYHTTINDPYS